MELSTLQKYIFREQPDGTMVGGFSINDILITNEMSQIEGMRKFEGLSVPVGLYSGANNKIMGGGNSEYSVKTTYGGTIDDVLFDKLYDRVAEHKTKTNKSVTKKKK
jgi:hypothetical protein